MTKVKTTIKNIKQLQKITSEIRSLMQINTITKALFGVPQTPRERMSKQYVKASSSSHSHNGVEFVGGAMKCFHQHFHGPMK